ncbi:M48 family metallopeptidase [Mesobacterium pallidum]|uniref:M48 family metallopeptidase n=1 Tax=Mesobacterium pallidum TaxID=2872037 RepID=UPI001EE2E01D|nr:SprT family zinc-dependent metalloprotease [Mesobacterium pallidum]
MGEHILPGNPPVALILRRSSRARRISLRVSGLDGRVTLTLPRGVSEREGLAFAREKERWLRGHLASQPGDVQVVPGAVIPVEGEMLEIRQGAGRSLKRAEGALLVPGDPAQAGARVQGWLKALARDRLAAASDRHAATLGRGYARLTLRDTRSRWGSCSSQGALMYSWRLVLAPAEVLDYVAAHEVAHLAHMDHSRAFWDQVTALYGDYSAPRAWLRTEGSALHRYRFGA